MAVTGGDWRNLSLSGQTASSSGFIWLGNGAAATNADLDLGRVNFVNGPTLVSQIAGSTQTAANDDGRLTFSTKATGGTLTERIRIDSSGRLLVGKTSGTNIVDILATDSYLRLTKAAVTNYCGIRLDRDASDNAGAFLGLAGATDNFITGSAQHDFCIRSQANILFGTNGAWPAARFTVGGQFLIGHDTVIGHNGVDGYLQVTGTGTDSSSVNLNRFSADNWCPFLTFGKSRNATKGSHTIVQDNDYLAYINFAASDGVDFNNTAAYIAVKVDGTPGTDDTPGRIEFATCPDGTNAATTRTTIDNVGATLFSGLTSNTDTRNTQGIAVKSPHGVSFNAFGGNGSRNWRIRPDDLNGWADLDLSCAPTDGAADWPDAATDTVLSLQGDTKDAVVSNGNLKIGVAGKGIMFHPHDESASTPGSDSNLLDDYEEGTFSPHLVGYDANNSNTWENVTFSSVSRYGKYVKVGNLVHYQCYFVNFHIDSQFDGTLAGIALPFVVGPSDNFGYSIGNTGHENCFANAGSTATYTAPSLARAYCVQEASTNYNTWSGSASRYLMCSGSYLIA